MFREFSPPPRQEMGLKHPENVFDGKFDQLAEAVRELDAGRLPAAETELPSGQVSMGERTEKAAKKEVELIFKQFKKGAQGFAELTAEKGSTFMALGAMVFPENPNLAFELATEMRLEGGVSKPVGIDTRVNVREEELVFQKMPVVSGENCLLAAGLRLMAERRYKNKGNQIVSTVAQLINWEGEGNDSEDSLSDNAIAWQKGSNENHNGILRRYIPKKTDLTTVSQFELDSIIEEINSRPRKCLNYQTTSEAMLEELQYLKLPKCSDSD